MEFLKKSYAKRPELRKRWAASVLNVGIAALLLLAGCRGNRSGQASGGAGSKAPAEANISIPALDGPNVTVAQYKGKVVLVNFWATWCQPCQKEIPWLIEFSDKYKAQGLVILGIS